MLTIRFLERFATILSISKMADVIIYSYSIFRLVISHHAPNHVPHTKTKLNAPKITVSTKLSANARTA